MSKNAAFTRRRDFKLKAGLKDGFLDFSGRGVYDPKMGLTVTTFPLLFDIQCPVAQRHDLLDLPQAKSLPAGTAPKRSPSLEIFST